MSAADEEARRNALLTNGQMVDLVTGKIATIQPARVERPKVMPDADEMVAMAKSSVMGSVNTTNKSGSFVGYLLRNHEPRAGAKAIIRNMLTAKQSADGWRGLYAVPPGSGLETVLSAFHQYTNIPLEIPFFSFLHYVSGVLLDKGVRLTGPIGEISPEMWTIILAPSGAGKTFASSVIAEAAPVQANFTEAVSGAAFFDALAARPWNLWTQDEIAQKLKQIEDPRSPLGEVKEYLLRTYDNAPIERTSKKDGTQRIERPTLGILGLNTQESFKKALSAESLLDGFAQRFGFVWAERDPARPMLNHQLYDRPKILAECRKAFDKLSGLTIHERYRLGTEAVEAFRVSFTLLGQGFENDESYFRRAMFRSFKYALIYHVLLGKEDDTLDAADIGWGARAASIHLADMGKIIKGSGGPEDAKDFDELKEKIEKTKAWIQTKRTTGEEVTVRTLMRSANFLKGMAAADVRTILELATGAKWG